MNYENGKNVTFDRINTPGANLHSQKRTVSKENRYNFSCLSLILGYNFRYENMRMFVQWERNELGGALSCSCEAARVGGCANYHQSHALTLAG